MGNSALKSHLETSQKTGVFQLTGKGLQEVRHTCSRYKVKRSVLVILVKTQKQSSVFTTNTQVCSGQMDTLIVPGGAG